MQVDAAYMHAQMRASRDTTHAPGGSTGGISRFVVCCACALLADAQGWQRSDFENSELPSTAV